MTRATSRGDVLVFLVVALGVGLRFLRLDADPYYYDWIGYVTDEGRWVDQAGPDRRRGWGSRAARTTAWDTSWPSVTLSVGSRAGRGA